MAPANTILIDLSVLRRGVLTQETRVQKEITRPKKKFLLPVSRWEPKPLPDNLWLRRQIECLPTIIRLAGEGRVVLYSYSELDFEEMRASRGMAGTVGDLFSGVEIKRCEPAANRPRFRKNKDFGYYLKKRGTARVLRLPPSTARIPATGNTTALGDAAHLGTKESGSDWTVQIAMSAPRKKALPGCLPPLDRGDQRIGLLSDDGQEILQCTPEPS
jgi:hypothetical protein